MPVTLLLSAALRIRMGRGANEVFAVIGGLVITAIVIALIVGPKKQKLTDPHTGLERQTLPTAPNPVPIWGGRIAAGLFGAVGLWLLVGLFPQQAGYGAQQAIVIGLCFGAATIAAFVGGWRVPACIGGAASGALLMLKPVIFPMSYRSYGDTGEAYPLSLTSETHLMFIVPGFLLCVLAALFYLRQRRSA